MNTKRCACGLKFIPTPDKPDMCEFCYEFPELRVPTKPPLCLEPKKYNDAYNARTWRERHKDQINAKRRQARARKKAQNAG